MSWSSDYSIDWASCGVVSLAAKGDDDSDTYTHFVHVSGAEVKLPASVQLKATDTLTWTGNWMQKDACAHNQTGTMQSPFQAFKKAGVHLMVASDCEAPLGASEQAEEEECDEQLKHVGSAAVSADKVSSSSNGEPADSLGKVEVIVTPQKKRTLPKLGGELVSGNHKKPKAAGTPPASGEGLYGGMRPTFFSYGVGLTCAHHTPSGDHLWGEACHALC